MTEIWYDIGGGWKKGAGEIGPDGFKPGSGSHEAQLRIDDAPKLTIHCSTVQEIAPMSGGERLLLLHKLIVHVHIVQEHILPDLIQ